MNGTAATALRALVERLEALAERRLSTRPRSESALARATRLADHLAGHVRVRAASLDAPLLVVLVGPTGAGKSTVFNTIAGRAASETGVLRPTTRVAVVLLHPEDRAAMVEGTFARISPAQIRFVEDDTIERGLVLVDAPDIDSVEHANRELTDRLIEAADLALFVTTATRYADRVPWGVLDRVRERGLPLQVIVNRMPPDASDRDDIVADVRRLLSEAGLDRAQAPLAGASLPGQTDPPVPREIVAVAEGALDPLGDRLERAAIAPVLDEIARLRADRDARLELAARALTGSLTGLGETLDQIADDAEHESIDVEALRRIADRSYESALEGLGHEVDRGAFLREEALRQWQTFVGADEMTRFFSQGIGRIRGAISAVLRPARAPVAEVRAATTEDLIAVARLQAAEAARRTATSWSDTATAGRTLAQRPELWLPSPDFESRLQARLERWMEGITEEIQAHGRPKRMLARGAAVGVNAMGTGVMLATFIHTGGITGAELGVAAATAFLNQKVLAALFGEAAMAELVTHARQRLDEALSTTFDEERQRYDELLPASGVLTDVAADLRAAAADVRALPAPA
jgi:energy-coupling factor transporter ATP-binding protein EcfA2